MEYEIIATGSTGNAVRINQHILIDCGVSFKKLQPVMRELNLVLLTHIHGDHFKGSTVRALHRARPALRFGCCEWMVEPLINAGVDKRVIDVYKCGDFPYVYDTRPVLSIRPVMLMHNVPNCGYVICEGNEKAFYATDTGTLDGIRMKNFDLYLIEANHTTAEIEAAVAEAEANGEYSYRIRAAENHLSQEQATQWLLENMGPKSSYEFLHQHVNREEADNGRGTNAESVYPYIEDG